MTTPFHDVASYTALPRLTGLSLAPDGTRLVVTMQQPDSKSARYTSSIWQVPLDGGEPVRLTRSDEGETAPVFLPDGRLLFTSTRPEGDTDSDDAALWALGAVGEPSVLPAAPAV